MHEQQTHPDAAVDRARKVAFRGIPTRTVAFLSSGLVAVLKHTPITPNQVSLLGLGLHFLGAWWLAQGTPDGFLWGALSLLAGYVFDSADGTLARAKGMSTRFGHFLDNTFGDIAEPIVTIGMVIGFYRAGYDGYVLLAPIVVHGAEQVITGGMSRYRENVLDPMTEQADVDEHFSDSWLLTLGLSLIPPQYLRHYLLPLFAALGWFWQYVVIDALYSTLLAIAFTTKVAWDVHRVDTAERSQRTEP